MQHAKEQHIMQHAQANPQHKNGINLSQIIEVAILYFKSSPCFISALS